MQKNQIFTGKPIQIQASPIIQYGQQPGQFVQYPYMISQVPVVNPIPILDQRPQINPLVYNVSPQPQKSDWEFGDEQKYRNKLFQLQNHNLQKQIINAEEKSQLKQRQNYSPNHYNNEIDIMRTDLEKLATAYEQLSQENEMLKQKLYSNESELKNLQNLQSFINSEVQAKDQRITSLEKLSSEWRHQENKLMAQIQELENQISTLKQQPNSYIGLQNNQSNLREKTNQLITENQKINGMLNQRLHELEILSNKFVEIQNENSLLTQNLKQAVTEKDQREREIDQLKIDNGKVSGAYLELKEQFDKSQLKPYPQYEYNQEEINNLRNQIITLERENIRAQDKLKLQESSKQKFEEERIYNLKLQFQKQLNELENDKLQARRETEEWIHKYHLQEQTLEATSNASADLIKFKNNYEQLKIENDQLRQQIEQINYQQKESKVQIDKFIENAVDNAQRQAQETIEKLQQRIQELEFQVNGGEYLEIDQLRRRVYELQEALKGADQENYILQQNLKQIYQPDYRPYYQPYY